MLLMEWDLLPERLKNEDVYNYYISLKNKKKSLILKRIFDFIVSILLLIILSPVFIVVSIWIKLDSVGPVFYRQERVSQYGKIFKIFKFRTMIVNADKVGSLVTIQNDSRITKVGEKIRKYRLDELPQLINVLQGDMSFVGTRPEVSKYVDKYSHEMLATLLLPAGITSLASIEFKDEDKMISESNVDKKFIDDVYVEKILPIKMQYNLDYLNDVSLLNDIKLCLRTVLEVIK